MTIGILFDSFNNVRFQKEKVYLEDKIAEFGGTSIIKSAEGNNLIQEQQAREMIEQGVDLLILNASNVNTAASIVRLAHSKNVKVIAYDRLIKNCDLDYYISFDGNKVGELLAEYVVKEVPEGNYVIMNGEISDENATTFYNGTLKIIQPLIDNGKINIVYKAFIDEWSGKDAEFIMTKILELSSEEIDAVISQYDGLSWGVIRALNDKGIKKKVVITGQDAEIDACKRIMNGTQQMTVYKPVKKMANKCVELAFDMVNSKTIESDCNINNGRVDVPTHLLEPIVVDKNNMEATVFEDGYVSKEEVLVN